ncbi:hypothetical protein J7J18_03035 [bacterium]|nr:hypothetical protein [bacterium]
MSRGVEGKVTAWGLRLQVPAAILRELELDIGDDVEWVIEERNGEKVAILKRKSEREKRKKNEKRGGSK